MKRLLPRMAVLALGLALVLGAVSSFGQSLPLPLEKKIMAGQTTIEYVGQSLRFTTTVPLYVKLEPVSLTQIRFTVRVHPGYAIPNGPVGSAENNLEIYWVNVGTDVYEGGAPSGTIEGVLDTEGGFVDR
ncbi:MAG TPA: hypothetical protein VEC56_11365 [Candidatus Krumholzibacteria bacterium]|nr:hypothetical protein [Candidatus Krumholzibacteria bacterium]